MSSIPENDSLSTPSFAEPARLTGAVSPASLATGEGVSMQVPPGPGPSNDSAPPAGTNTFQTFTHIKDTIGVKHSWTFDEFEAWVRRTLASATCANHWPDADAQKEAKGRLPYFTPCTFRNQRGIIGAEKASILVYDLDKISNEDLGKRFDSLRAQGVRFFAYGSPSDGLKPGRCVRIVLPLDEPAGLTEYDYALKAIRFHLLPDNDQKTEYLWQPFYVGRPVGTAPGEFWTFPGRPVPLEDCSHEGLRLSVLGHVRKYDEPGEAIPNDELDALPDASPSLVEQYAEYLKAQPGKTGAGGLPKNARHLHVAYGAKLGLSVKQIEAGMREHYLRRHFCETSDERLRTSVYNALSHAMNKRESEAEAERASAEEFAGKLARGELVGAPAPEIAPGAEDEGSENLLSVSRDAVRAVARNWKRSEKRKSLGHALNEALEGHRFAENARRRDVQREIAKELAREFPDCNPLQLADHLRLGLERMVLPGETLDGEIAGLAAMIDSAQKSRKEKKAFAASRADARVEIVVTNRRIADICDDAIKAVAPGEIYQRSGKLVHVTRESGDTVDNAGIRRRAGTPTIRGLQLPTLREKIDRVVRFRVYNGEGDLVDTETNKDHVQTVATRGQWEHIRRLTQIVSYPIMRPDGSIFQGPGYDEITGTLSDSHIVLSIPDKPTHQDARQALVTLAELVCEFPFESAIDLSVWLAAFFTVLTRPAIDGHVPATVLNANKPGTGKTLLAQLIGLLACGERPSAKGAPTQEDEWRKTLVAVLTTGDPIVLFDNVRGMVRSESLEAMITNDLFGDRRLGKNDENLKFLVRLVLLFTANNASFSTDMIRRSLRCNLETVQVRGVDAQPFRIPNIVAHVKEHRAKYLSAAFTILRAYEVAGRPAVKYHMLPSFESWANRVSAPLVWLGLPDPSSSQIALREDADLETDDTRDLFAAWYRCFGETWITTKSVVTKARTDFDLADAIRGLFPSKDGQPIPSARDLGMRLASRNKMVVAGLRLVSALDSHTQSKTWRVTKVGT